MDTLDLINAKLYKDFQPIHFNSFDELVEWFGDEPWQDDDKENCRLLLEAVKEEKDKWLEKDIIDTINSLEWEFEHTIYMLSNAYRWYIEEDVCNRWNRFADFIESDSYEDDYYHKVIDREFERLIGADESGSPLCWWRKEDFYDEVESEFEYIRSIEYKGYEYIVAKKRD